MSLPELTRPIRLYWDLTPLPCFPVDQEKICSEIIGMKILTLDLTATGELPDACFKVLEICAASRLATTLTISPEALTVENLARIALNPPRELLLEIHDMEQLHRETSLPPEVSGISFPVTGSNWNQIPALFGFAFDRSCKRLVLPMQRLYWGEKAFHLTQTQLQTLTTDLMKIPRNPQMGVTVHDPFLWRGIFPDTPFPQGRCQAANTMLSIDPAGIVYPCPTMPIPLGDLNSSSLLEIARGEKKKELRKKILSLPADCADCCEAVSCKGGCRGRGENLSGSWETIDPACR